MQPGACSALSPWSRSGVEEIRGVYRDFQVGRADLIQMAAGFPG